MKKDETMALMEALRGLLVATEAGTQESICSELERAGYDINQSKVSRLLRKIGAVKVVNSKGQTVYSLPREPAPPTMETPMRNLIIDVVANEVMVVVYTSPGSASMVARILDYKNITTEILGTVAGDDTIFVAPKTIKETSKLHEEIRKLLISVA